MQLPKAETVKKFPVLLLLDFQFVNNFKKNNENVNSGASMLYTTQSVRFIPPFTTELQPALGCSCLWCGTHSIHILTMTFYCFLQILATSHRGVTQSQKKCIKNQYINNRQIQIIKIRVTLFDTHQLATLPLIMFQAVTSLTSPVLLYCW
jgi:hypothetical protein